MAANNNTGPFQYTTVDYVHSSKVALGKVSLLLTLHNTRQAPATDERTIFRRQQIFLFTLV